MEKFIIPKDYHSELNLHDTQIVAQRKYRMKSKME